MDGDISHHTLIASIDSLEGRYTEQLLAKRGGRAVFVHVQEIDWIEARRNYLRLHKGADSYVIRRTMRGMEASLDPGKFLRIHRSAIVNIEQIEELLPMPRGEYGVRLRSGSTLTLSRGYRRRVAPRLSGLSPLLL